MIIKSSTLVGLEARPVGVEAVVAATTPSLRVVGMNDAAARNTRVRVTSALAQAGVPVEGTSITVNLTAGELLRDSPELDLAIALAALGVLEYFPAALLADTLVLGELSLDGRLCSVRGVLSHLEGACLRGDLRAIIPAENGAEGGLLPGLGVSVAASLTEVLTHLRGDAQLAVIGRTVFAPGEVCTAGDLSGVRGQAQARRALEIAAAGNHNLLMVGPPGGGKTLLARLLPSILPPFSFDEAIETTAIHSVAGLLRPDVGVVNTRPFRAPHHSVGEAGLLGGGVQPRPGEVSLAHNGVLLLDELVEFRRSVLEALGQVLEEGRVRVTRALGTAWFPARPLIVGATTACPCGYAGRPRRECRCSPRLLAAFQARLEGPLLDWADMQVNVLPVARSIKADASSETSSVVRARVVAARTMAQNRRECGAPAARPDRAPGARLERVARTIADLEGSTAVQALHRAEAHSFIRAYASKGKARASE